MRVYFERGVYSPHTGAAARAEYTAAEFLYIGVLRGVSIEGPRYSANAVQTKLEIRIPFFPTHTNFHFRSFGLPDFTPFYTAVGVREALGRDSQGSVST